VPANPWRASTHRAPKSNVVIVRMSFVDAVTESHDGQNRRAANRPTTAPVATGHMSSGLRKPGFPSTHRSPMDYRRCRATASYCRMGVMPQTRRARVRYRRPTPPHRATAAFGAARRVLSPVRHLPTRQPSIWDISQAETTAPTRRPRERHAVQAHTGPSTGSDLVGPARVRDSLRIAARCPLSARRRLNARLAARRGRHERDFAGCS
jgi:hypothetical protein